MITGPVKHVALSWITLLTYLLISLHAQVPSLETLVTHNKLHTQSRRARLFSSETTERTHIFSWGRWEKVARMSDWLIHIPNRTTPTSICLIKLSKCKKCTAELWTEASWIRRRSQAAPDFTLQEASATGLWDPVLKSAPLTMWHQWPSTRAYSTLLTSKSTPPYKFFAPRRKNRSRASTIALSHTLKRWEETSVSCFFLFNNVALKSL